jgi:CHAD domain-containing protein
MAYSLSLDDLAASVKRVAGEQLGTAADGLEQPDDPVEAVHDARKRLKKTRSLLRLARPAMRPDAFRAYNRELRDQGRALSGARDADVMVETVDVLAEHNTRRVKRAHFMAVRGRFVAGAAGELPEHRVPALAGGVDHWPLGGVSAETILDAVTTTYRRGRKAAAKPATDENLHEWRKRVKDLWYQARLLSIKRVARDAKKLSKLLGSDHDLATLSTELPADDPLQPLIDDRRAALQKRARTLGARVYEDSPKAFRKRVRKRLRAVA